MDQGRREGGGATSAGTVWWLKADGRGGGESRGRAKGVYANGVQIHCETDLLSDPILEASGREGARGMRGEEEENRARKY